MVKERGEVFEAISHPVRIKILKILSKKPMRFADLKRKLKIRSSGALDFHLKKLNQLITTNPEGKYTLTKHGYAALEAITVTEKYGWQKRAFYLNILAYLLFNVYFAFLHITWFWTVFSLSTLWIAFYSYWTFIRRGISIKYK